MIKPRCLLYNMPIFLSADNRLKPCCFLNTIEKWNEFKSEYEKRGGSRGMGPDYFFFDEEGSPSELETFAFQLANELVDSLGKEEAVSILQQQHPDHEIIRDNSASFRDIEKGSDVNRPEFREMLKRAKQYAKNVR